MVQFFTLENFFSSINLIFGFNMCNFGIHIYILMIMWKAIKIYLEPKFLKTNLFFVFCYEWCRKVMLCERLNIISKLSLPKSNVFTWLWTIFSIQYTFLLEMFLEIAARFYTEKTLNRARWQLLSIGWLIAR